MENKTVTISRTNVKLLYQVACGDYKLRLKQILEEQVFETEIALTVNEVKTAMERAGREDQKTVLLEVFGSELFKSKVAENWEELESISGYFVDTYSEIVRNEGIKSEKDNRNVFAAKSQALSALAAAQLSQLMKQVNGDWTPDWTNIEKIKYVIGRDKNSIFKNDFVYSYHFLSFQSREIRDQFLTNHTELIKQYFEL